ncbi:hypothetical protein NG895_02165 [Aeoliella sp. ICT_H6.2]|uniref:Uncharacterized protein n=1 Tax=Aeoliella straminimaris TaxID=2954799 RepID=A0A9X2JEJ0_9BACT|nr:hypothetical protein [Aeoliella straminimaris]MCO6042701.1 hypothetical protein [Aeoliella straminimaris]
MATKPIDDDFDGAWFYGLAMGAVLVFSWHEIVTLFAGEAVGARIIAAWFMCQLAGRTFCIFVDGLHAWFVKRLGPLVGVVTTILLVVVLVRGSLMIAVHAKTEQPETQQSHTSSSDDLNTFHFATAHDTAA